MSGRLAAAVQEFRCASARLEEAVPRRIESRQEFLRTLPLMEQVADDLDAAMAQVVAELGPPRSDDRLLQLLPGLDPNWLAAWRQRVLS